MTIPKGEDSYGIVMTSEMVLSQTFVCTQEYLHAIVVTNAVCGPEQDSTLSFVLNDAETGDMLQEWTLDAAAIGKTGDAVLNLTDPLSQIGMNGKPLRLRIWSDDATGKNAMTLYATGTDGYGEGKLIVNGEDSGGDLCMILQGYMKPENYEGVRIWTCVYTAALCIGAVILAYRKSGGWNPEHAKEKKHAKKRR